MFTASLRRIKIYEDDNRPPLKDCSVFVALAHGSFVVKGHITAVNQSVVTNLSDSQTSFVFDQAYELDIGSYESRKGDSGSAVFVVDSGEVKLLAMLCSSEGPGTYCLTTRRRRLYALSTYDGVSCLHDDETPAVYIPADVREKVLELSLGNAEQESCTRAV